ncbi:MAG: hypothetical protein QOE36_3354 [Gaiellaceae bacterium]|nr:hypothetical protein [Gaiellaceae bacterium]
MPVGQQTGTPFGVAIRAVGQQFLFPGAPAICAQCSPAEQHLFPAAVTQHGCFFGQHVSPQQCSPLSQQGFAGSQHFRPALQHFGPHSTGFSFGQTHEPLWHFCAGPQQLAFSVVKQHVCLGEQQSPWPVPPPLTTQASKPVLQHRLRFGDPQNSPLSQHFDPQITSHGTQPSLVHFSKGGTQQFVIPALATWQQYSSFLQHA